MRELTDRGSLERFMKALGQAAASEVSVYFTGGATAVLLGWRPITIDVDLKIAPEEESLFRALPSLKESLRINIELACPADFIPELPGWRERSLFIQQEGRVAFLHYDLYAQALAKIERAHARDTADVREMIRRGFVEPARLLQLFEGIEDRLYRYPALDPASFRRAVESVVAET